MRLTIRTLLTTGALAALAAFSAVALPGRATAADGVDAIKKRGTLIVGVKADYKPFGFRDPSGTIIGLEPDLAADLAKRLGVKLELVPVVSANRIEFLQQGKVDLLIATLSDKPERRRVVQAIDPNYYSDFVNVLLPKSSGITDWAQLKGKPVCATSGAWYNKDVARTYGAEIVAFDGSEKPLFALKQGNCIGYVYDQSMLQGKLLDDDWKANYALPLKGILDAPWMMAVAQGNTTLQAAVEDATKDWMKTGFIVNEEKKWGIEPTAYSKAMYEKYKNATN
ncbi:MULTISPECIES: transporter substrate-binding domain-containing protein [Methylobacterium]|jgi:polar amino acid transport system substrate-binding protein|uniref:Polar amino acid transport system substrate-binding protein n=1 Tax=Methylobacterium fujisawaense TaxID=107400 RepID=A0ABR6D959_9HYPH|nr:MULTISPECIES: transporter substrate-binding domain-containing protein [Methylobacterium]KOX42225.1 ABC transporter substrate-binding protein [Streptomyces purpurogeneiscleroticus]MBA9062350.1 polar amino acid transport system substrate-binding protein [Methylobacterium fujisawaense]MBP32229.1 ABC transporter substrate-binding protein [Methylobacterium sp.]MDE4912093.1 transporter substrate-binding domain-containing protein [Methylobacterium sp. 092160098-2]MDH3032554.1 transporter substrate